MSSYFGSVEFPRASNFIKAGTYLGVSPEFATVLYRPGDHIGLLAAVASLVPIAICVALLSVFLARRTAIDLWIGCGQIACEIVNGLIKIYVKQPRPSSPVTNIPADSYGMPSAHAQYMGYIAMVVTVWSLDSKTLPKWYAYSRIFLIQSLAIFTAYSRYYLYYHSLPQVVIGYFVGAILGFVWLRFEKVVRKIGLMQWGLNLWPCRLLMVKDVNYDVCAEYKQYIENKEKKVKKNR